MGVRQRDEGRRDHRPRQPGHRRHGPAHRQPLGRHEDLPDLRVRRQRVRRRHSTSSTSPTSTTATSRPRVTITAGGLHDAATTSRSTRPAASCTCAAPTSQAAGCRRGTSPTPWPRSLPARCPAASAPTSTTPRSTPSRRGLRRPADRLLRQRRHRPGHLRRHRQVEHRPPVADRTYFGPVLRPPVLAQRRQASYLYLNDETRRRQRDGHLRRQSDLSNAVRRPITYNSGVARRRTTTSSTSTGRLHVRGRVPRGPADLLRR